MSLGRWKMAPNSLSNADADLAQNAPLPQVNKTHKMLACVENLQQSGPPFGALLVNAASIPSGENEAEDDRDAGTLWSQLGLPEPEYLDESQAPRVDRALLLRLIRRNLSAEEARAVYWLIISFVSWRDAHAELVADEFRRRPPTPC
jgi:hypothetical protein